MKVAEYILHGAMATVVTVLLVAVSPVQGLAWTFLAEVISTVIKTHRGQ